MARLINATKSENKICLLRGRTPLAAVLGLGRQESLTPDKRDVCLVGRNEATFGTFFDA